MGKLEQGLFDLLGKGLKGREVVHMSVLLFELLPKFLNRVVVRRLGRELEDLKPCRLLGKDSVGLSAGLIFRSSRNQHTVLGGVLQDTCEKGHVGSGVEAAFLPLIKETPGEVITQPKDFIAFAPA
jgi:hypothetical protein